MGTSDEKEKWHEQEVGHKQEQGQESCERKDKTSSVDGDVWITACFCLHWGDPQKKRHMNSNENADKSKNRILNGKIFGYRWKNNN